MKCVLTPKRAERDKTIYCFYIFKERAPGCLATLSLEQGGCQGLVEHAFGRACVWSVGGLRAVKHTQVWSLRVGFVPGQRSRGAILIPGTKVNRTETTCWLLKLGI